MSAAWQARMDGDTINHQTIHHSLPAVVMATAPEQELLHSSTQRSLTAAHPPAPHAPRLQPPEAPQLRHHLQLQR